MPPLIKLNIMTSLFLTAAIIILAPTFAGKYGWVKYRMGKTIPGASLRPFYCHMLHPFTTQLNHRFLSKRFMAYLWLSPLW